MYVLHHLQLLVCCLMSQFVPPLSFLVKRRPESCRCGACHVTFMCVFWTKGSHRHPLTTKRMGAQLSRPVFVSATFPQSDGPLVVRWPPHRRNEPWSPSKDLADLCGVFMPSMLGSSALLGAGGHPRGSRWHGFTFWGLCGYGSKMFYRNKQPGKNQLSFWMGTALTLAGLPLILELLEGPNRALYSDKQSYCYFQSSVWLFSFWPWASHLTLCLFLHL